MALTARQACRLGYQQHAFGKPARGRYHNKQWADWMDRVGLMPTSTGRPGGKRTGDRMTHLIVPGGPFAVAAEEFLAKHPGLQWGDRPVEPKSGGKRSKYVCSDPECKLAAWSRPGIQLLCGEHDIAVLMLEIVAAPT